MGNLGWHELFYNSRTEYYYTSNKTKFYTIGINVLCTNKPRIPRVQWQMLEA